MKMNINLMIKYFNWKDRMNVQVHIKYRMKNVIVVIQLIKIIRMQSIVIFVHWHIAKSADRKQDSILSQMINHKEGMCVKNVIVNFISMKWWKINKNKFKKQI